MWIQAIVTRDEFARAFDDICPAHVEIDEGRWIDFARPHSVDLIPERGIRVRTEARVLWTVIGIDVPITVIEAELFFLPKIVDRDGVPILSFEVTVGELDLKFIPHLLDAGVATKMNDVLAKAGLEWDFMETLAWRFQLPKQLSPAESIHLHAKWAEVRITPEAVTLAVSFAADVSNVQSVVAA